MVQETVERESRLFVGDEHADIRLTLQLRDELTSTRDLIATGGENTFKYT